MMKKYKMGKLTFSLSGQDKIIEHLANELSCIESFDNTPISLDFNFKEVEKKIKDAIYVSPVIVSSDIMHITGNGFDYNVSQKDNTLNVSVSSNQIGWKAKNAPYLSRLKDWNYLSPTEQIAKNFMYNAFDYLTQIANLKNQQSYFHASSFQKNDKCVAIVAWGGIGKTTSLLKLVTEDNWKFLSDDLGLIDANGMIYRVPKKLQVYAYNILNQQKLKNLLLRNRPFADLLNWHYKSFTKGIKGVRRRVSAEELFGISSIGSTSILTDLFFIERANISDFSISSISVEEISMRAASTIMSEMDPFHKISSAIYSVQQNSPIPRYDELFNNTFNTLSKAFSHTSPKLIKIPLKASPDDLANFLRTQID